MQALRGLGCVTRWGNGRDPGGQAVARPRVAALITRLDDGKVYCLCGGGWALLEVGVG